MTGQYWPFWAGALALGGIATLHAVWLGRPLGVSGSLARVARPSDPAGVGSVWVHVAFLCAIAAGALAAALIRGTFRIELAPGPSLRQLCGLGFGDFTEVHRMFTLQDARLYLTFAGAVGVAALGLRLFVRVPPESTRLHRSVPLGSVLFGVGWALCGACPGIGMVGVGQGALPVAVALGGMIVGIRAFDFVNGRWLRWQSTSCGM